MSGNNSNSSQSTPINTAGQAAMQEWPAAAAESSHAAEAAFGRHGAVHIETIVNNTSKTAITPSNAAIAAARIQANAAAASGRQGGKRKRRTRCTRRTLRNKNKRTRRTRR